jgi:hypothetical protein
LVFLLRLMMHGTNINCCSENINTHFIFSKYFFRKSCRLWNNVKNILQPNRCKYGTCELHVGYIRLKHIFRICNTEWFSTATMAARTCLKFTLQAKYLACNFFKYIIHVQCLYQILPTASTTIHINALYINITEVWIAVDPLHGVIMLLNLWIQCHCFCYY